MGRSSPSSPRRMSGRSVPGRSPKTRRGYGTGMSTELPLYRQEKRNTCALACLRMVLAAYRTQIEESALEAEARMEVEGTPIDELERLARLFGLTAEIQETTTS